MKKLSLAGAFVFLTSIVSFSQNTDISFSATLTAASSDCSVAGSCLVVSSKNYRVAGVTISGTYNSSAIVFEYADDGLTNWFTETCARVDSPIQETGESGLTNTNRGWDCGVFATNNFRVRQSAITSGGAKIVITLSQADIEPAPTVVIGTGTSSIGAISNLPATVDTNSGNVSASTIRTVLAGNVGIPLGGATIGQTTSNGAMAANDLGGVARVLGVAPFAFDGTNSKQIPSASLANSSVATGTFTPLVGVQLQEKGPRWTVTNVSTSGNQATVSKAAVASTRHVVDCIGFSADSAAAVTAANTTLNVRDGATGAGTVIWSYSLSFPTAGALGVQEVAPVHICGLNLVGTTNTAMTIEYAGGITGAIQNVNMSGYDIN